MELIRRARGFGPRIAIVEAAQEGQGADQAFTYEALLAASAHVANRLRGKRADLGEERVAFLVPPGFDYVAMLWGVWRAGGIAVPLCLSHPRPELEHVVSDSDATVLVAAPELAERLDPIARARGTAVLRPEDLITSSAPAPVAEPDLGPERRATIIYTSGTTGAPKGVVSTHGNLQNQMETLVDAWGWTAEDRILNVLPLHHVHGVVNVLGCAVWSGATWETLEAFDAEEVWRRLAGGRITLFMAVPTIYHRLIRHWKEQSPERRRELSAGAHRLRLMVSGSAALPVEVLETWEEITGHRLLERYGMTEIGMGLSNPLHGLREPGKVGRPLPGVEVRIVDGEGEDVPDGESGELLVRGPSVFQEYWRRPEATAEAFLDGWFRTGDVVRRVPAEGGPAEGGPAAGSPEGSEEEPGSFQILGRSSVDILKTGGYKVSALEIEGVLLRHPDLDECAVVGLPDPEWGQLVAVAAVPAARTVTGQDLTLDDLQAWARERLAPYKLPRRLLLVEELPKNALGKVQKPKVTQLFSGSIS